MLIPSFTTTEEQDLLFTFLSTICEKYPCKKKMLVDLVKLKPDPTTWFDGIMDSLEKMLDVIILKNDLDQQMPGIIVEIMVLCNC